MWYEITEEGLKIVVIEIWFVILVYSVSVLVVGLFTVYAPADPPNQAAVTVCGIVPICNTILALAILAGAGIWGGYLLCEKVDLLHAGIGDIGFFSLVSCLPVAVLGVCYSFAYSWQWIYSPLWETING